MDKLEDQIMLYININKYLLWDIEQLTDKNKVFFLYG